jgi:uncharacterized membrane protein
VTPTQKIEGWPSARQRLAASVVAGAIGGGGAAVVVAWQIAVLTGWCAGAVTFLAAAWAALFRADGERTRAIASGEDESRFSADVVVLAACVASLVGVGLVLVKASGERGIEAGVMVALGVVSVVVAWAVVHTVFTVRYADLYYANDGGIDFNGDQDPDYRDFAYLAFTIGMTYQVSDTELQTKTLRRTALRHALLSYLFGTAIIAVTINVVAGLAR